MKTKITPEIEKLESDAKAVLLSNRRIVRKKGVEYGFTCPSPELYHWQWLWDSCFHVIALRWFDPDFARREIISLLSGQWEDGRVPNMVHVRHNWRFDRLVHGTGRDSSGITQPPIIADAVLRVHRTAPDAAFIEKVYEPLARYYEWLKTARETDGDGLIAIYHPWESGIDNSPRWDTIFNVKNFKRKYFNLVKGVVMFRFNFAGYGNDTMRRVSPYFVKGIDMNCYYCTNLRAMAEIARIAGKSADAEKFEAWAETTKNAILSRMWDPEKKQFGDLIGEGDAQRLSIVPTPFSFLPAWAGIVSPQQAELMHAEITDPARFWLKYPIATTAMDWPAFDPEGYWRGTTWINSNWFIIEALARYGFTDDAETLKEKTLELVSRGGFREYYNPITGEGLGAKSFAWTSLVIDLIHRDFEDWHEFS